MVSVPFADRGAWNLLAAIRHNQGPATATESRQPPPTASRTPINVALLADPPHPLSEIWGAELLPLYPCLPPPLADTGPCRGTHPSK